MGFLLANEKKDFQRRIDKLSKQELRELVMINTYKLRIARTQLEAVIEVLIEKKIATYEDIWKRTHEKFKEDSSL